MSISAARLFDSCMPNISVCTCSSERSENLVFHPNLLSMWANSFMGFGAVGISFNVLSPRLARINLKFYSHLLGLRYCS